MAAEVGRDEGTDRRDAEAARSDVLKGAGDEAAADAVALLRRRNVRVHEDDHAGREAIGDAAEELVAAEDLVPELLRVVPDHVLVGHDRDL